MNVFASDHFQKKKVTRRGFFRFSVVGLLGMGLFPALQLENKAESDEHVIINGWVVPLKMFNRGE